MKISKSSYSIFLKCSMISNSLSSFLLHVISIRVMNSISLLAISCSIIYFCVGQPLYNWCTGGRRWIDGWKLNFPSPKSRKQVDISAVYIDIQSQYTIYRYKKKWKYRWNAENIKFDEIQVSKGPKLIEHGSYTVIYAKCIP